MKLLHFFTSVAHAGFGKSNFLADGHSYISFCICMQLFLTSV